MWIFDNFASNDLTYIPNKTQTDSRGSVEGEFESA